MELQGRVALVTGSARRVGRAIALEFARQGASVVIHSSDSAAEAESAAEGACALGVRALVVQGDQSNAVDVARIVAQARAFYGGVDILVNSASIFRQTEFLDIGEAEYDRVLGINLKGPFLLTQQVARSIIERGVEGAVVNISDNSGLNPWKSRPHHSISKAGLIMLTQVAALALAEHRIRVNCVVPGPVLMPPGQEDKADEVGAGLPLGHIGRPQNVADACVFLVRNDFATGTILRVDGGEGMVGGQT